MTLDHLYIRYFNTEVLVASPEEAFEFLANIPDVIADDFLLKELQSYYNSKLPYPKRFKVRQRCYFIVIKTNAKTLEEFKSNGIPAPEPKREPAPKPATSDTFDTFNPGWYDVSLTFKRVVVNPVTSKCSYVDTDFRVRLKAHSVRDSFNRVCDHLRNRHDVDPRSQMPSIKGRNFTSQFLGMN